MVPDDQNDPNSSWVDRVKTVVVGKPRNLTDDSIHKHVTLIAFLAWVGLGADGLSSSCYGPSEAFAHLIDPQHGDYHYLAIFLTAAIVLTVFIISACYSHIIEEFSTGGGGYLVASKLLGRKAGVVSGCALLVDYVLTITVSIAAAGQAIFGLVDPFWQPWKIPFEIALILLLIVLNLRGVQESVKVLLPIFILFLISHLVVILGAVGLHLGETSHVVERVSQDVNTSVSSLGVFGMLWLLLHAYSMGAGTYTGIEAVSSSMNVMREPRVATAKRTMLYMAISLAFTAGGLMLAYLLMDIRPEADRTMNLILTERLLDEVGWSGTFGQVLLWLTIFSEGALLFVAAQAGFIGGPRVLAYMARDSWMPHWFAHLSERLATHNGIMLMGLTALAALLFTHGSLELLITMYSINVFVTFALSMVGMVRHWWQLRGTNPLWKRRLALFLLGATLCIAVLCVTVVIKFNSGGWVTVAVTSALVYLCFYINRHYRDVLVELRKLDKTLGNVATVGEPITTPPDPTQPTAVVLVGGYSGLGVHTLLNAMAFIPNHFRNVVFISAAVVDSGNFKGSGAVEELQAFVGNALGRYVDLANRLGIPATSYSAIGIDAVDELETLCRRVATDFPRCVFFAGQLIFARDTLTHRLLHNQTAFSLQRRLQWDGLPMVILPTRVRQTLKTPLSRSPQPKGEPIATL